MTADEFDRVDIGQIDPSKAGTRLSGWMNMGYTYASSGAGRLAVAPQLNRFGDEYLLNELALTLQRPVSRYEWSWGYYIQMLGGADASTLEGLGDIHNTNPRFGGSVRQVRFDAHLPILNEEGVELVIGRQGSLMGYESYMAPLRPFYSLSYQWFYAEDGANTGVWATAHPWRGWDVTYGVYLGSNTLFALRGDAPCQALQIKQWLDSEQKHYQAFTLLIGDQAIGRTIKILPGTLATVLEWRAQFAVSENLTQVIQANGGIAQNVEFIGTGRWYGVLGNTVYRMSQRWDAQARLEWFDDPDGLRTGRATNYVEVTTGTPVRVNSRFTMRPELRGDFAGARVFGPLDSLDRKRQQLTAAFECVWTF